MKNAFIISSYVGKMFESRFSTYLEPWMNSYDQDLHVKLFLNGIDGDYEYVNDLRSRISPNIDIYYLNERLPAMYTKLSAVQQCMAEGYDVVHLTEEDFKYKSHDFTEISDNLKFLYDSNGIGKCVSNQRYMFTARGAKDTMHYKFLKTGVKFSDNELDLNLICNEQCNWFLEGLYFNKNYNIIEFLKDRIRFTDFYKQAKEVWTGDIADDYLLAALCSYNAPSYLLRSTTLKHDVDFNEPEKKLASTGSYFHDVGKELKLTMSEVSFPDPLFLDDLYDKLNKYLTLTYKLV